MGGLCSYNFKLRPSTNLQSTLLIEVLHEVLDTSCIQW